MKRILQSFALLLVALMAPVVASAADVQVANDVYQDGSTLSITSSVTANSVLGDVNSDGDVNIADVTSLIDYILGNESAITSTTNADTNSDGMIGIADVTTIIDYILAGGVWPWEDPLPVTETFTVNGVTFTMVAVEGGTFTMGSSHTEAYDREKPTHEVTLSGYRIGQTEVTQALWLAVMGSNPSYFNGGDYGTNLQRPVEKVSWNDCQTFITKLNQLTGKTFRLPTEAEWEYAARGGKQSQGYIFAGSNTIGDVAWCTSNSSSKTHPVATKAPNELGLYDMTGNVREWCQDWYGSYSSEAQTNPVGPSTGSSRVYRGGSHHDDALNCRVSNRLGVTPTYASGILGLRLAL